MVPFTNRSRRSRVPGIAGLILAVGVGTFWSWTSTDSDVDRPRNGVVSNDDVGGEVQQLAPVASLDIEAGGQGPGSPVPGLRLPAVAGTPARRLETVPGTSDIPFGG